MKYIESLKDGDRVRAIYLCKSKSLAMTKNGKEYENVGLQDKTGTLDGKIWDPNSNGIFEFDVLDYVEVNGVVTSFNGMLQLKIDGARKAEDGEYDPADYLPTSRYSLNDMFDKLMGYVNSVENEYLKKLLYSFFVDDEQIASRFKKNSAAKSIHHGFIGGLLEHSLSVTKMCDYMASAYDMLNRDLLITAAMLHDIGKVKEISQFPENDYTDEGNLIGHIVIGSEMISVNASKIDGFPEVLLNQLKHCILSHHGELEYGSPKKPCLIEAVALSMADNADAKLETMREIFDSKDAADWTGYNRMFETNLRRTRV